MMVMNIFLFLGFIGRALLHSMPSNQDSSKMEISGLDSSERTTNIISRFETSKPHQTRKTIFWTQEEEDNLKIGVQKLGNKWLAILQKFKFHPSRTTHSLFHKFRLMSIKQKNPNSKPKIVDIKIQSENKPVRYRLLHLGGNWVHAKSHLPEWKLSMEEFHNKLIEKGQIVSGEIEKLSKLKESSCSNSYDSENSISTESIEEIENDQIGTTSKSIESNQEMIHYVSKFSTDKKYLKERKISIPWTQEETSILQERVKQFGCERSTILNTPKFNKYRNQRTLQLKNACLTKEQKPCSAYKIKDIARKYQNKSTFYRYSNNIRCWLPPRHNDSNWKELLKEYEKELIKKLETICNEIDKLDKSVQSTKTLIPDDEIETITIETDSIEDDHKLSNEILNHSSYSKVTRKSF